MLLIQNAYIKPITGPDIPDGCLLADGGRIAAIAPLPRADHRPVGARLVRRAHRKLIHVELAQHARARLAQVAADGALIGRLEALQDVRPRGRVDALGREQVLDAERDAGEREHLGILAGGIGAVGGFERELGRLDGPGVERAAGDHGLVEGGRDLARAEVAGAEAVAQLGQGEAGEVGHYSITFGTAKNPSRASGAFFNT